jgi:putative peptidoglycan lipid II flippase
VSQQLFKSTAIVSSMTLLSRILGFVRDMLIGQLFGVSAGTDAFFVAFKIPNFLRRLFAEGAFAQAFIPVLADYKESDKNVVLRTGSPLKDCQSYSQLKQFIDKTAGTLALILSLMTVFAVLAAPLLILLFAPGFAWQGSQHDLAVQMLRITFPYLLFISLVAFAGAILNSYQKFAIPAVTPVFLNLCLIAAAIWLAPLMTEPVTALAWGVFAAGVVQLVFQLPALKTVGLLPRLKVDFQDAGVKQVIHLMIPAILGSSLVQINLLLNTLLASFLPAGSVSWLYYSDRLVEFPLGILGIALGTVILPQLSKNHAAEDSLAFSHSLDWGLRLVLLVGIPASLGLLLMAEPILSTLFQYKEFAVYDVQMAGRSLMAYSVGLVGFMLVKILVPGFTSRKDMKTPVRFGIYAIGVNMVLGLLLILPLAHAGLALATSLGAFVNAGLLWWQLAKEKVYQPVAGWPWFLGRLFLANAVMAAGLYYVVDKTLWYHWSAGERMTHLVIFILTAMLVYLLCLGLLGFRVKHLFVMDG